MSEDSDFGFIETPQDDQDTKPEKAMGSLYKTESGGRQFGSDGMPTTSPKGATGIAQVMPTTGPDAAEMAGLDWDPELFKRGKTGDKIKDKEAEDYNKALGEAYFKNMLNKFDGDYTKAYAAYNAGPGRLQKVLDKADATGSDWKQHLPDETKKYIQKNMANLSAAHIERKPSSENFSDDDFGFVPSEEEISNPGLLDKVGNILSDAGRTVLDGTRGGVQGLTLGGSDEIVGGIQSIGDYLTDPKVKTLFETARKHQKESEAANDAARERSPLLYNAANIVGSIPAALLASKSGNEGQAGSQLAQAGKQLTKAGSIGSIAGMLSSHGDMDNKENMVRLGKDTAEGAGIGLLGEAGAIGAGAGVSKSKDIFRNLSKKYDFPEQLEAAVSRGYNEGKGYVSKPDRQEILEGTKKLAKDVTEGIEKGESFAGEKYNEVISSDKIPATLKSGPLKTFTDLQAALELPSYQTIPSVKATKADIQAAIDGTATLQDLKNLEKNLSEIPASSDVTYAYIRKAIEDIDTTIMDRLEIAYPNINKTFRQSKELAEAGTNKVPEELSETKISNAAKPTEKKYTSLKDIIQNSGGDFSTARPRLEILQNLQKKFNQLRGVRPEGMEGPATTMRPGGVEGPATSDTYFNSHANPELMEASGLSEDTIKQINAQAREEGVMQTIGGTPLTSDGLVIKPSLTKRGTLLAGNLGGQAARSTVRASKWLYTAPTDKLLNLSAVLKINPKTAMLGQTLENSVNGVSNALGQVTLPVARNAILFSIMQHPEARQALTNFIPLIENDDGK